MPSRFHEMHLDVKGLPLEQLEGFGTELSIWARGVNFWIGDVARQAERVAPEHWQQAFPEWVSPGLIARCKAVAEAYPNPEDRNPLASWSIHMRLAKDPDRIAKVRAHVEAGRTSDEAAKADRQEKSSRWLLAIDVNYFLHRQYFSGAGAESAIGVAEWIGRTVQRMQSMGLTDVVCCFDGPNNHRKELTKDWELGYKSKRSAKEPELAGQLELVRELLEKQNFACVSVDGYEGDDVQAAYAKQFPGRVTLFTPDKDARQCLSPNCNILLDVEWFEDETTGEAKPTYKWVTRKSHTEQGCTYSGVHVEKISPEQWCDFQAIAGDSADDIQGAKGIGAKIAASLIQEYGSAEAAIQAAKDGDERIKPAKREALIELEPRLEVTRKLVTMQTNLSVPMNTRIACDGAAANG